MIRDRGVGRVDGQERDQGRAEPGADHRLDRAVVLGSEHEVRLGAPRAHVVLDPAGAAARAEADQPLLADELRSTACRARPASGEPAAVTSTNGSCEQLDRLERALLERQHAEREVERARSEELEQALVAVGLGQADLDVGPRLAEAADDRGQHPRADALVHADAQRAGLAGRVGQQVRARGLEAVGDRLHVALEQAAGLGELDRPPAARPGRTAARRAPPRAPSRAG